MPVRMENGTNELWYTIPCHLQPNNTRNISIVLCVLSKNKNVYLQYLLSCEIDNVPENSIARALTNEVCGFHSGPAKH